MMMLGKDKNKIGDSIIEGILGAKKEYSTAPAIYPESAKMCAIEFLKAIESKDPNKVISAFMALDCEVDMISEEGEEEEQEGPELEIKL